jgi:hypothetical protein
MWKWVDPGMLGKIFEELVTGRHESGSYYGATSEVDERVKSLYGI